MNQVVLRGIEGSGLSISRITLTRPGDGSSERGEAMEKRRGR
jgi:hypothetical protein